MLDVSKSQHYQINYETATIPQKSKSKGTISRNLDHLNKYPAPRKLQSTQRATQSMIAFDEGRTPHQSNPKTSSSRHASQLMNVNHQIQRIKHIVEISAANHRSLERIST